MDLAVHPREHDLVLGTHGRSAYVLDDIRPLREISEELNEKTLFLFEIPPAQQYRVSMPASTHSAGTHEFRGENKPYGALITFWMHLDGLPHPDKEKERERRRGAKVQEEAEIEESETGKEDKKKKGPEVEIEILDQEGKGIRTFKGEVHLGINRVVWDLRMDPFKEVEKPGQMRWEERRGSEVKPGHFSVRVKYKEHAAEGEIRVLPDPRQSISKEARNANFDALMHAGNLQEKAAEALERIQKTRKDLQVIVSRVKKNKDKDKDKETTAGEDGADKELLKAAKELKKELRKVEELFWTPGDVRGIPSRKNVTSKIGRALRFIESTWDKPTPAQLAYLMNAEAVLEDALHVFNRFYAEDVTAFRNRVREMGINLLPEAEPVLIK
jgi:hypothetical protein